MTDFISPTFIRTLCEDLQAGEPVRRRLPVWGRLYIDPERPFLCVYRRPPVRRDPATAHLVTSQASYLLAPGDPAFHDRLSALVAAVARALADAYGGFLLVEVWSTRHKGEAEESTPRTLRPVFRLTAPEGDAPYETVTKLAKTLKHVSLHGQGAEIGIACTPAPAPPGLEPLLPAPRLADDARLAVGLEVAPFYRDAATGVVYPFLFDDLRRQFDVALRQAFFLFSRTQTRLAPAHYLALGRSRLDKTTLAVDHQLAHIDETFAFLLQITPVNAHEAWEAFARCDFEQEPDFQYRPLPVDPERLKRELFALPVEKVEDPLLAWLFREKQEELDRRITMLRDRGTRQFFFGSLQLFGEVEPGLLELAEEMLDRLPHYEEDYTDEAYLTAAAFAEAARREFDHYRAGCPAFPEHAHIRADLPAGLMVSSGRLLIGADTRIPAPRVEALLQHEVGTHMVTYYNGSAQPLRLFCTGLAGYEALQEGLAVLAEFLVDGLTIARLRVLAARVVAAHCLTKGASFVEVFRRLRDAYAFGPRVAFTITMRTFRGGGLIKDVIYLRGLRALMHHLRDGGDLEPLFVGKIALTHLDFVCELEHRGILRPAPLRPRCLDHPAMPAHLERIRSGLTLIDFFSEHPA